MSTPTTSHILRVSLSDRERRGLDVAFRAVRYPGAAGPYDDMVAAVRRLAFRHFPERFTRALEQVRGAQSPPTAVIVENLPHDQGVAWAPARGDAPNEALLIAAAAVCGEPYNVEAEGPGLISDVIPSPAHQGRHTGLGYDTDLDFHIENAQLRAAGEVDRAPSGLILLGRVASGAHPPATRLADARVALAAMDAALVKALRAPLFELRKPIRHRRGEEAGIIAPLVKGPQAAPLVQAALYGDMIRPLSPLAAQALGAFRAALASAEVSVQVSPGTMLIVPNGATLHARGRFTPRFSTDGRADRWLQRCFFTADLSRFADLGGPSDRVFRL